MRLVPSSLAQRTALATAGAVFLVCLLGFGTIYLLGQIEAGRKIEGAADRNLGAYIANLVPIDPKREMGCAELRERVEAWSQNKDVKQTLLVWLRSLDGVDHDCTRGEAPLSYAGSGCRTLDGAEGRLRACGQPLEPAEGRPERILVVVAQVLPATGQPLTETLGPPLVGLFAAAAAAAVGYRASRRLEKRLAQVSAAAEAVMAGDLARRMPLLGSGDEFDRLVGTVNAVLARVEALVAGLRQVTENIAHDLRTPLQRMHQALELALHRRRDAAADEATFATALEELNEVLGTFRALLRIASVEAGLHGSPTATVDLGELVTMVGETYQAVAEEEGQQVTFAAAPGLAVRGDAPLLRQALANLVQNALLHGGKGVQVRIAASAAADGGALLEVADDGPGIPAAEREKVLGRFYRLDRSRTTPGTGLGLALVAAAAKLHGARLTLGDAGPGLRVSLAFPPAA